MDHQKRAGKINKQEGHLKMRLCRTTAEPLVNDARASRPVTNIRSHTTGKKGPYWQRL